jgi:hypothetical protein
MVYLNIAAMFVLVLWPALLPLAIHGSHAVANRGRKSHYADQQATSYAGQPSR